MSYFDQLLTATIVHLREEKARGIRVVEVSEDTLETLAAGRGKPGPGTIGGGSKIERPDRPERPRREATSGGADHQGPPKREVEPEEKPMEPPRRISLEEKEQGLGELRQRVLACQKCPNLASSRQNVVFGAGDISASLMFVGEAPGADEDAAGEPFVGVAGQLLTRIIGAMGLSRETVYIANVVKCRPDTPGELSGNRKPTPGEMTACLPYLEAQIDLIQPSVIVALGGTALEGLFGKGAGITKLRGHWKTYRGIAVMPTFHPSYLQRMEGNGEKRKVWEDMLQVMARLGLPISDKQRGYFLKSQGGS